MDKSNKVVNLAEEIADDVELNEKQKAHFIRKMSELNEAKVNILITGATGSGKSSTINALFGADKAKVGQGVNPETMDIKKFELNNIILWDSPGLGDGKEADRRHAKNIIDKLAEKDSEGNALIDLVLVVLDGASRDLGTSYELINEVIIPSLGDDTDRLLVAINQCDIAMKGRYWNEEKVSPEPKLVEFLEEKVASTKKRIKEATGVDVEPIYYSAGYKDEDEEQQPYNLSKLLMFIVKHTKAEKRAVYLNDINTDKKMWEKDDDLEDYRRKVEVDIWESIKISAEEGGEIGMEIGEKIGEIIGFRTIGKKVGEVAGKVAGGFTGAIKSIFGW